MRRVVEQLKDASGATAGTVAVSARGRLPTDVAGELMDLLAVEPGVLVCDLTGMGAMSAVAEVFVPVASYLEHWPGTVVVAHVDDPRARRTLLSAPVAERLLVPSCRDEGVAEAHSLVPTRQHTSVALLPVRTTAYQARAFVTRALLEWRLPRLVTPAGLVVSEMVTNAVVHAASLVELSVTRIGQRVRIGVRDHAGGWPEVRTTGSPTEAQHGRGLLVVREYTECWGVLPGRLGGKTVWAVLDAASHPSH